MFQNKKIVSLIPLRGGSRSIPHKNIKEIAGKPLCYWTLKAASDSSYIDEVWVSTEDKEIKEVVLSLGLSKVKVIDRPLELAQDLSSTDSVMLHLAEHVQFDVINLIQATSPFTTSEDLNKALEQFSKDGNDSLLTGVLHKKFYWTPSGKPLNYDYLNRPMRQQFEGVVNENGAFYLTTRETLMKYGNRLGGKIGIFLMPEEKAVDINELSDWPLAEALILKNKDR
jgi:CMP-N-acetylneuraminic acid synthetase